MIKLYIVDGYMLRVRIEQQVYSPRLDYRPIITPQFTCQSQ